MAKQKWGSQILEKMAALGLYETRNLVSFEGSNIQDDIRRTGFNQQREMHHFHHHEQEHDQSQELQQER